MTEGHVVRDELAEGEAARLREMGVTVTGDEFFFTPALCATSSLFGLPHHLSVKDRALSPPSSLQA